jgi:hypothetical protein
MLNQFKTFNTDAASLEEMIALSAFGKLYAAEFELYDEDVPVWVTNKNTALTLAIQSKLRDKKLNELSAIDAQLGSLKTREEKKAELLKKKAKLNKVLASV